MSYTIDMNYLTSGADLFTEKSSRSFWEQRMESHRKFIELQQEAPRRRMLMKLCMDGGSVSAAELLTGLL